MRESSARLTVKKAALQQGWRRCVEGWKGFPEMQITKFQGFKFQISKIMFPEFKTLQLSGTSKYIVSEIVEHIFSKCSSF